MDKFRSESTFDADENDLSEVNKNKFEDYDEVAMNKVSVNTGLFCCAMCCCLETYNKSMLAFSGAKDVSEKVGRSVGRGVVKFAEPVPRPAAGWFGETAGFRQNNGPIG